MSTPTSVASPRRTAKVRALRLQHSGSGGGADEHDEDEDDDEDEDEDEEHGDEEGHSEHSMNDFALHRFTASELATMDTGVTALKFGRRGRGNRRHLRVGGGDAQDRIEWASRSALGHVLWGEKEAHVRFLCVRDITVGQKSDIFQKQNNQYGALQAPRSRY